MYTWSFSQSCGVKSCSFRPSEKKPKTSSERQFCRQKRLVDERHRRTMSSSWWRLAWFRSNHCLQPWWAEKHPRMQTCRRQMGYNFRRPYRVLLQKVSKRSLMLQWEQAHRGWTDWMNIAWSWRFCPQSCCSIDQSKISSFRTIPYTSMIWYHMNQFIGRGYKVVLSSPS